MSTLAPSWWKETTNLEIKSSEKGRGVYAKKKKFLRGELILTEQPLSNSGNENFLTDLVSDQRIYCLQPICSETPREEEKTVRSAQQIFDDNCFAGPRGVRLLFLHGALFNHSCEPNADLVFSIDMTMKIFAVRDIAEGEEICISYLEDVERLEQRVRRTQLKLWFDCCFCTRCARIKRLESEIFPGS